VKGRAELTAVWALIGVVTVEILATYWRLPWNQLYHVTGSGPVGGLSRALLFLNFPAALVAIAVLLYLLDGLDGAVEFWLAVVGIALCAVVAWPKLVDQGKLDARPVNAIPAVGVAIAFGLTLWSFRRGGSWRIARVAGDRARIAIALVAVLLALPWEAADLGFSLDGVPGLGSIFLTASLRTQPGDPVFHPAVHHGHHHGMDGTLLVLVVLILSRLLGAVRGRWLRGLFGAYLAVMFCYGIGNIANDAWLEQVVKRGWTLWEVPDVTTPKASPAWGLILLGAVCLWLLLVLPGLRQPARSSTATP
jgi:hypothetical protein